MKTSVRVCVYIIYIHTSVFIYKAGRAQERPVREQHASGIIDKAATRVSLAHTHTHIYTQRSHSHTQISFLFR